MLGARVAAAQDFIHFEPPLRDNVSLATLPIRDPRRWQMPARPIWRGSTVLARGYEGAPTSGGQWQRTPWRARCVPWSGAE